MSEECTHDCSTCSQNCADRDPSSFLKPLNPASSVKKVIGVVSGKGGVGKSMVTSLMAVAMARRGYKVGILDADITGPSIPQSFGIHGNCFGSELGIEPANSEEGIEIMSINLLWITRPTPSSGAAASSPVPSPSSGRTCTGATWTICSWICLPEPATCP